MIRDEGGDQVRLDLCGPDGIIGSVTVRRSVLPLLALRILEAAQVVQIASQGAQERPEVANGHEPPENGEWPSEGVRMAYEAYRAGRAEEAMQRDKVKDLFKRKGGK